MRLLLPVVCLLLVVCSCSTDRADEPADRTQEAQFAAFDTPPAPVESVTPAYPDASRRAGETGRTMVEVTIDEEGAVQATRVVESSGHAALDAAAEAAAKAWRFTAAKLGTRNVTAKIVIPFQFKLD